LEILSDDEFISDWIKRGLARRRDITELLQQTTSNSNSQNILFVDLGWNGTIQNNLAYSLFEDQKIHGLYFGLNEAAYVHKTSNSSYTSLVTHKNSDFYSHSIFTCPNLIEILLLAPHESPSSVKNSIRISELESQISVSDIEKRRLGFQANTLRLIKPFEMGHLLFKPSSESYAQLTRTLISKMVFLPTNGFAADIQNLETEYGFSKKKYFMIAKNEDGSFSLGSSIWRYGASTLRFGKWLTILLIARDSIKWGMPSFKPTIPSSQTFGPVQNSLRGEFGATNAISISSEYETVLNGDHIDRNIPRSLITNRDLVSLRIILVIANALRFLKRMDRFDNFSLPTKNLLIHRVFKHD
jgi:hypothetical protein